MSRGLPPRHLPVVGDRAFAIDAAAIAVVSVAITWIPNHVAAMTVVVLTVMLLRTLAWSRLPLHERGPWTTELAFVAMCTVLGGFNDWSSVVHHRIYDYTVAVWWPEVSTIPLWMLIYWGMILRFVFTLTRWQRLGPPTSPRDVVSLGRRSWRLPSLKVAVLLALTAATRQCIYRFWSDPWLSWLPFAGALLVYALICRPSRHDRRLMAIFAVGGPAIEVLYINVGGLHRYELGWLGGVPLWIALWWLLAVLVWKDLGARLWIEVSGVRLSPFRWRRRLSAP